MSDLLSAELQAELGLLKAYDTTSGDALPVVGKKDKRQREEEVPAEIIEQAKILSKKAQKRLDAINQKKEKDEKTILYYNVLKKHEIQDEHRQLLTSSRDLNQQLTMKKQLKNLHRRYKAGIALNEDEMRLLFPYGNTEEAVDHKVISELVKVEKVVESSSGLGENTNTVALDLTALCSTSSEVKVSTEKSKKKSKKRDSTAVKESSKDPTDASDAPVAKKPLSLGANLMMQLSKLKSTVKVETAVATPAAVEDVVASSSSVSKDTGTVIITPSQMVNLQGLDPSKRYIPKPVAMPFSATGQIIPTSTKLTLKSASVSRVGPVLHRDATIQANRMQLPVCGMEQEIVESITQNDVVILCGETGSGKSTQIPQFLFESGYGKHGYIGCTQPRRVAATSTASRVSFELGEKKMSKNGLVAYQIRFDSSTVGAQTQIKFMTDGILLREITSDLLLSKYSVIILDEAHERNVNTDILLGMISRTLPLRKQLAEEEQKKWNELSEAERELYQEPLKPLKLVIMSATLRIDDFKNPVLFPLTPPPVISVEARQYPVVTHFSKRTEVTNYLEATFKKVCQIHRKLPAGGVLVFLTGKREILHMCRKINRALNKQKRKGVGHEAASEVATLVDAEIDGAAAVDQEVEAGLKSLDDDEIAGDRDAVLDPFLDAPSDGDDDDEDDDEELRADNESEVNSDDGMDSEAADIRKKMLNEVLGATSSATNGAAGEDKVMTKEVFEDANRPQHVYVLPLYAMMPGELQNKVFHEPPEGHRLIIIATNVAETSITIPGIKYVVDCGRQKVRTHDLQSGINKYEVEWISKASANQRQGRAGRTGPGHCYRLYSSAFYDQHMKLYQEPEISTIPLEDLLLQMRALGISEIESFPFPTAPPPVSLRKAQELLLNIGVVKSIPISTANPMTVADKSKLRKTRLTEIGHLLAQFPIAPRYSKMLVAAHASGLLRHAIAFVASMVERSPFLSVGNSRHVEDLQFNDAEGDEDDESEDEGAKEAVAAEKTHLWFHPDGDSLARNRTIGAYLYAQSTNKASNDEDFCKKHNLHCATIQRMADLRLQLIQSCQKILFPSATSSSIDSLAGPVRPPSVEEEQALKQLLVTGFCDNIAKKVPIGIIKEGNRKKRMTAYFSCNAAITEPLYIHPQSALYQHDPSAALPEYVVYTSLVTSQRGDTTYMSCVTAISAAWIAELTSDSPLLIWTKPLENPPPYYDPQLDEVMCYLIPKYGIHKWDLPPLKKPLAMCVDAYLAQEYGNGEVAESSSLPLGYRKQDESFRWFARLLLEGAIDLQLPSTVLSKSHMKESPSVITQMKPNSIVLQLLRQLVTHSVNTRRKLLEQMKVQKGFLGDEIEAFLQVGDRKQFRKVWNAR